MRISAVLFLSSLLSLHTGAAELPVTEVTLYKHGIGLFARDGIVPPGQDVRLEFQNNDMNDLLKSLIVTAADGAHVKAIRYDANETLEQRLSKFPFHVGDQQPLSAFLDTLKGSRIELTIGTKSVSGSIVGARALAAANATTREQISVLQDSGDLANYDLATVDSMHLLDTHQQEELKAYLQTLADSTAHDRRSVFIESDAKDSRRLHLSYIAPTAIWKSSYRLTLEDRGPMLEGWAIVDNTTGEDWNNIRLAVVSGRPISFISPLDTARYGNRQVAELPEDKAAGPVVYGGSVDEAQFRPSAGLTLNEPVAAGSANGLLAGSGGGAGGGVYRQFKAAPAPPAFQSSVQGATGATLGELFEYSFADPITIKKNQSAMLPFLQNKVQARKLLIWTDQDGEHPVNAAELTNSTGKTLDGGPVTVYDSGAYAGEALFETLKATDKRLIGYAVDYGTRVTSAFDSGEQNVGEVKVQNGTLNIRYAERQTQTYTIHNVDAKPKTLIVQRPSGDYKLVSPKPLERTANAYRFEVNLPANTTQTLKVELEQTTWSAIEVSSATPDTLAVLVVNKELPDNARAQLKHVVDLKTQIASTQASLTGINEQIKDLSGDQTRLRANIDSLNRVSGEAERVHTYSAQLAALEGRIATLRDQGHDQTTRKADLDQQLHDAISKLDF
jgi:hypothetical protein